MVTHIVGWTLREDLSEEEKTDAKIRIKDELEALVGVVPGLISAQVYTELMPSSTFDLALVSTLDDEEALKGYQDHSAHLAAASFVRSVNCGRQVIDFIN